MTQNVNTAVSRTFTLSENNKCMNRISMEQRAIRNMPEGKRHALFVRTLQNLKSVCTAPEEAMHAYCAEQARLALEFSECDPACQALASRQISRVPRPR